jgi:chromosome segregation ATPase
MDHVLEQYKKLQDRDRTLEADIKELASAVDSHTVDNRNKRNALQERRNHIAKRYRYAKSAQQGPKAMQQLLQSVESELALAAHAETWEWKKVGGDPAKLSA